MEPRIFVSSTFYDLKYAREQLGHFIENYGFKPILFENGDVGYSLGEELDLSCFTEMKKCDMAILIVGGRYGSPISEERLRDGTVRDNFEEYTSVTCKEFMTAIKSNIPVYVFIEASVNEHYSFYRANRDAIETNKFPLNFPGIDNINVFRFIHRIRAIPHLQIEPFRKINDIEGYLRKQWASLFQQYLHETRNGTLIKNVETPMQAISSKIDQLDMMLSEIARKVIGVGTEELNALLEEKEIDETASKLASSFEFLMIEPTSEKIEKYLTFFIDKLIEVGNKEFFELPFSEESADTEAFYSIFIYNNAQITDVKTHLSYDNELIPNLIKYKSAIISKLMNPKYLKVMKFL